MNNIQKAFKAKAQRGLRLADGGQPAPMDWAQRKDLANAQTSASANWHDSSQQAGAAEVRGRMLRSSYPDQGNPGNMAIPTGPGMDRAGYLARNPNAGGPLPGGIPSVPGYVAPSGPPVPAPTPAPEHVVNTAPGGANNPAAWVGAWGGRTGPKPVAGTTATQAAAPATGLPAGLRQDLMVPGANASQIFQHGNNSFSDQAAGATGPAIAAGDWRTTNNGRGTPGHPDAAIEFDVDHQVENQPKAIYNAPSLRMADGGMFDGLKRMVGMGPAETVTQKYARQDAERLAKQPQPVAPAPAASAPAPQKAISQYASGANLEERMKTAGLRNGGDLQTGMGGAVPGTGQGDKIPAKYEPGEFVVSNAMLDAAPGLREQLHDLRGNVLHAQGKSVAATDAKALHGGKVHALDAGQWESLTNQELAKGADRVATLSAPGAPAEAQQMAAETAEAMKGPTRPVPGAATPPAPAAAVSDGYRTGQQLGRTLRPVANVLRPVANVLGKVGPLAAGVDTISHFNDYKINDPDVDSSNTGTMRALGKGDWAGAGKSFSKGALEAGMDLGSTAAGIADLAGYLPGVEHGFASKAYGNMLRGQFGDQLIDNTGAAPKPAIAPKVAAPVAPDNRGPQLQAPSLRQAPEVDWTQRAADRDALTQKDINDVNNAQAARAAEGNANQQANAGQIAAASNSWEERKARRNAEVDLSSIMNRPADNAKKVAALATLQGLDARQLQGNKDAADTLRTGMTNRTQMALGAAKNATDLRGHQYGYDAAVYGHQLSRDSARWMAMRDQANKDREFNAGRTDKAAERDRQGQDDLFKHALSATSAAGPDGKPQENPAAAQDYVSAIHHTVGKMIEDPNTPAAYRQKLQQLGPGGLDAADRAAMASAYRIRNVQTADHGVTPWKASGGQSKDLRDYMPTGKTAWLAQDRLVNKMGSVPVTSLQYPNANHWGWNSGAPDMTDVPPSLR